MKWCPIRLVYHFQVLPNQGWQWRVSQRNTSDLFLARTSWKFHLSFSSRLKRKQFSLRLLCIWWYLKLIMFSILITCLNDNVRRNLMWITLKDERVFITFIISTASQSSSRQKLSSHPVTESNGHAGRIRENEESGEFICCQVVAD